MTLTIDSTLTLHNGVAIPRLGLGVFRTDAGSETRTAVNEALALGYRHVDTARIYGNECDVGEAVRHSGVPRGNVFVTTKLWNSDHGYDAAIRACHDSLARLGLDYVDLYLIHWPVRTLRMESWRALETLQREGKCRAIGVSNYTERHLQEIFDAGGAVPAVNQVEFSPYLNQSKLLAFCDRHKIVVEAYSPLTKGQRLGEPRLTKIAAKYGKSTAQVLIRWALQHGMVVLPKSARPARIRVNANVFDFEITRTDMTALDAFDENLRTSWDPTREP